jgi:hypothetical protein
MNTSNRVDSASTQPAQGSIERTARRPRKAMTVA